MRHHVCKYSGERNAHEHEIERNPRKQFIAEKSRKHRSRNARKQDNKRDGFVFTLPQKQSCRKSDDRADDNRQENHHGNHIKRNRSARNNPCYQGIDGEKDGNSDNIVQHRHRQKRIRNGSFRMKFVDNGKSGRRSRGKSNSAENEAEVNRNISKGENNTESKADNGKRSERLGQSGNHQCFSVAPQLLPHKLRSEHQTERTLHPCDCDFVPSGTHHLLRHQSDGVRTENHSDDEPP